MEQPLNKSAFARQQRIGRMLLDAIQGKEFDYTQGSIRQAVVLLAVPMVLEMLMESIFAVVDIYFVSSLGEDAVAVVGITEAAITIVYALAIGFSMAVTAVVARRIGEKNPEGAALATGQTLWVGLIIGALVASVGLLFAADILRLIGGSDAVVQQGTGYTTIMLGGSVTVLYLFMINAAFRGAGNASIAMQGLWLANAINIVLDPCLIFGWGPFPELGVTGAAVATNIGRGTGALFLLYTLFSGHSRIPMGIRHLQPAPAVMLNLLRISAGGIGQFIIGTSSWIVLVRIVSAHGSVAVAGYTIGIRVIMLTFLPAWGISNAAATLVGQNLGDRNPQRAEQSVWQVAKYNFIFLTSVGIMLLIFAESIVALFPITPAVLPYAADCLRIVACGYGFFAIGLVLTSAFNGAGDTITPTWINFICFWMLQLPIAWSLANPVGLGATGVFISIAVAESLIAILAYWQFRKGYWKQSMV